MEAESILGALYAVKFESVILEKDSVNALVMPWLKKGNSLSLTGYLR